VTKSGRVNEPFLSETSYDKLQYSQGLGFSFMAVSYALCRVRSELDAKYIIVDQMGLQAPSPFDQSQQLD
jgi:hypothetical protein